MVTPTKNPHMCLEIRTPVVPSLRLWVFWAGNTEWRSLFQKLSLSWILDLMASFPMSMYILTVLIICKTDKKDTLPLTRKNIKSKSFPQIVYKCPQFHTFHCYSMKLKVLVIELSATLFDPMDLQGSSAREILQARILEWVAILFSRGSFQLRDQSFPSLQVDILPLNHQGSPLTLQSNIEASDQLKYKTKSIVFSYPPTQQNNFFW